MRLFFSLGMMVLFTLNMQAQLNDYKYIVIPKQFDSFKRANQYQTSTTVKYLFTSNGFNAVYEDALPEELYTNPCLGLKLKLDNRSTMFTTKTTLILEDCKGNSVFSTQEGKSREKDFKLSYREAISQAFESIKALNYVYSEKNEPETVTLSFKNDVKQLKEDIPGTNATGKRPSETMVKQETTIDNQSYKSMEPTKSNLKKGKPETSDMVEQVATIDEQSYKDKTPVQSAMKQGNETSSTNKLEDIGVLYAQELPAGFQLVDSSPKIVMTLSKTSMNDVYSARYGEINGLVFKKDNKWMIEYTEGEALVQKELNIKF